MMLAAQNYLEGPQFLNPEKYFCPGGTLSALTDYVKKMIDAGSFVGNDPLRVQVELRLEQCISYCEGKIETAEEGLISWIWRQVFGISRSEESLDAAKLLYKRLATKNVSCLSLEVLFAPERSLGEIIDDIRTKVWQSDLFGDNQVYRSEIQNQLYLRVKKEWDRQAADIRTWASWFFRSLSWAFRVSALRRGIDLLRCMDRDKGVVMGPHSSLQADTVIFENAAWMTDANLYEFAEKMPHVQNLYLKGSFQLTDAGIERARMKFRSCRAIAFPDGLLKHYGRSAPFPLPGIFRKGTFTEADRFRSDLDNFVVV